MCVFTFPSLHREVMPGQRGAVPEPKGPVFCTLLLFLLWFPICPPMTTDGIEETFPQLTLLAFPPGWQKLIQGQKLEDNVMEYFNGVWWREHREVCCNNVSAPSPHSCFTQPQSGTSFPDIAAFESEISTVQNWWKWLQSSIVFWVTTLTGWFLVAEF